MDFNLNAIEKQIASDIRIDAQGKATFSIRAVARLAGLDHSTLVKAFLGGGKTPHKMTEFLIQQGVGGGDFSTYGTDGVPDIAAGLVVSYYAMLAGERCTKQALQTVLAFNIIGMRVYAQKITQWQPEQPIDYPTAIKQLIEQQMPAIATDYKPRFTEEFWKQLERVYGLKRGQLACANFIKWRIYRHFPKEVCDRLEAVNPLQENGHRANRFHQHFTDSLLILLQARINQVTDCLSFSDSKKHFQRKIKTTRRIVFDLDITNLLKEGN